MNEDNQGRTDEQYNTSNTPAMFFAMVMIAGIIATIHHVLTNF